MLSIIKNNWYRLKEQKQYLIVAISLTILSVALAVILTNNLKPKINIGIIGGNQIIEDNSILKVTYLEQEPPVSELIQNRYDAVVKFNDDGTYNIQTVKGEEFKEKLNQALQKEDITSQDTTSQRNIGTNIIGYMFMFLLMQGVLYSRLFAEDKEKHMIERIAVSPIAFWRYLTGHIVFIWTLIFVPSFLVIVVSDLLGVEIGFLLYQYAILIAIISMLSTCFAVCLNAFYHVADTANMAGSSIIVLTSVLGGAFYDVGEKSSFLNNVLYILPQKGLMQFINDFEKQIVNQNDMIALVYVIMISIAFVAIGVIKTRKDYVYHRSR